MASTPLSTTTPVLSLRVHPPLWVPWSHRRDNQPFHILLYQSRTQWWVLDTIQLNHTHSGECLTLSNKFNYSNPTNVLPLGPSDVGVDLLRLGCHLKSLYPKPCSTYGYIDQTHSGECLTQMCFEPVWAQAFFCFSAWLPCGWCEHACSEEGDEAEKVKVLTPHAFPAGHDLHGLLGRVLFARHCRRCGES